MIGPAELEDICLDLQAAGSGTAADAPFHPSFHPAAAIILTEPHDTGPGEAAPAADQPSCVSSKSSGLSIGTR
jgi:hypothetical protein